jgi:hypothetical protein
VGGADISLTRLIHRPGKLDGVLSGTQTVELRAGRR